MTFSLAPLTPTFFVFFIDASSGLYGSVKVKIPKLSQPDNVLRIKEHGIPNMNTNLKGDMYLILQPKLPAKLLDSQLEILELYKKSK